MNIPAVIGLVLINIFVLMGIGFSNLASFIDTPSLQFVVGVTVASALITSPLSVVKLLPQILHYGFFPSQNIKLQPKSYAEIKPFIDMFESMSRVAIGSGILGTLVGLILMLGHMSEVESIGPNMAVALITLFYSIFLSELILQPLKRMIISRFESSPEVEEIHKELLKESTEKNKQEVRQQLIVMGIFIPIMILFVLLGSIAGWLDNEKESSIWEKNNVSHLAVFSVKINGDIASTLNLPASDEMKNSDFIETAICNNTDSLVLLIDTVHFSPINNSEIMMNIHIASFTTENPPQEYDFREVFQYPISLKEERTICYESNIYSIEFTVTPVLNTVQES